MSLDPEDLAASPVPPPPPSVVTLDVGGQLFRTYRSTLTHHSTFFRQVFDDSRWGSASAAGPLFVDRDPRCFDLILNHLRDPRKRVVCDDRDAVLLEFDFYGIPPPPDRLLRCRTQVTFSFESSRKRLTVEPQLWVGYVLVSDPRVARALELKTHEEPGGPPVTTFQAFGATFGRPYRRDDAHVLYSNKLVGADVGVWVLFYEVFMGKLNDLRWECQAHEEAAESIMREQVEVCRRVVRGIVYV
jgi:hypothetical protein